MGGQGTETALALHVQTRVAVVYNRAMRTRCGASSAGVAMLACWTIAVSLSGCGESAADRAAAAKAQRSAELARDPELADALGQALLKRANERASGWVKHDHVLRGSLAERGRQAFLSVLPIGRCYRFLAVSGAGVIDLDLALFDGNGVEVARDVTEDPTPELGVEASFCPTEAMQYRIEARLRRGQGEFALGVFRSE
jgi:hypothetical protein